MVFSLLGMALPPGCLLNLMTLTFPALHFGASALMSAESKGSTTAGEKTTFFFGQDVPIPTYLLALVVGKLEGRYEKQAMTDTVTLPGSDIPNDKPLN